MSGRRCGALLRQQIDGPLLRLAVDPHVGDAVEPQLGGRLDSAEVGQLEPGQEVLLDVAHPVLHAALLVAPADIAGRDGEAEVVGEVQVARIEHRRGAGQALQHRRFEIVDHDFGRHPAQGRRRRSRGRPESAPCVWETVNSTYIGGCRHSTMTKKRQPPAGIAHRDRAEAPQSTCAHSPGAK